MKTKEINEFKNKYLYENLKCSICCEIFNIPITLNCSHSFCKECIDKWRSIEKKCPNCNEIISEYNISYNLNNIINEINIL